MTIEAGIVERIKAIAAVTALVSTRVYPLTLPQKVALPAVRVQVVWEVNPFHLRGAVNVQTTRIQVDAFAVEKAQAIAVLEAIAGNWAGADPPNGLSGWSGAVGGSPATLLVRGVFPESRREQYVPDEIRAVRVSQDYRIVWSRM